MSNNSNDDNRGLPKGIKEARRASVKAIHNYEKVHQTSGDREDLEKARAALHSAVMLYWNELKRFHRHPRIYELWNEDELTNDGLVLEDLRTRRFGESTKTETIENPETNATEQQTVREPWRLHPRQALAVHDRLDDCLHKLGIDQGWLNETRERYRSTKKPSGDPVSDDVKQPQ